VCSSDLIVGKEENMDTIRRQEQQIAELDTPAPDALRIAKSVYDMIGQVLMDPAETPNEGNIQILLDIRIMLKELMPPAPATSKEGER
jgi:hypothetical protein